MTARRGLLWLVAGIAIALLAGRWLAGLYADWAFHHALGADAVWRTRVTVEGIARLALLVAVFAFAFANFYAVRQSIVSLVLPRQVGNLEIGEAIPTRRLTIFALAGALGLALLFAFVEPDWTMVLQAFTGERFAEFEPYFERDLGFFVHWLPFERSLYAVASVLLLLTALIVVGLYAGTPSLKWTDAGLYVSAWVRRHLGILGGLAITLVAWDWRLDRFGLLTAGSGGSAFLGEVPPFSAYDHRVLVPWLVVSFFLAIPVALVFAWAVWRGMLRLALTLVTAVFVVGPVARVALPLVAAPTERGDAAIVRERPYSATRTLYTRRAFGVDRIATPSAGEQAAPTPEQLARWGSSWDPAAMTRYLEFERRATDVTAFAWQGGPGGLDALLYRSAADDAPPGAIWPADRLLAAAVDANGFPTMAPGVAPRGVGGVLVHPGASRYALVADTAGRLLAPPFESSLERLALAWDLQNPRLFASQPPTPRPRLVTRRDVRGRLGALVPFLRAGPTVTAVARGDSLYWVVELFSVATEYPLSEQVTFTALPAHYVQHAATAVVQSQTGRVMLIPVRDPDPVMRTWMRRFPSLFTPRPSVPGALARALPPAIDWVMVQGALLGRTGLLGDTVPIRALARVDDADPDLTTGPATPFQADTGGALAWGVPLEGGDNGVAGILVARGGAQARTELVRTDGALSWTGVLERLQLAADEGGFARALQHSRRGRVQAIPTSRGPAFVQSFYEWAPDAAPRLAGVVVLIDGRTMVGRSLADALGYREEPTARGLPVEVFRARAAALYDAMAAAMRTGDWRAYGEASAALGRLLGRPQGR